MKKQKEKHEEQGKVNKIIDEITEAPSKPKKVVISEDEDDPEKLATVKKGKGLTDKQKKILKQWRGYKGGETQYNKKMAKEKKEEEEAEKLAKKKQKKKEAKELISSLMKKKFASKRENEKAEKIAKEKLEKEKAEKIAKEKADKLAKEDKAKSVISEFVKKKKEIQKEKDEIEEENRQQRLKIAVEKANKKFDKYIKSKEGKDEISSAIEEASWSQKEWRKANKITGSSSGLFDLGEYDDYSTDRASAQERVRKLLSTKKYSGEKGSASIKITDFSKKGLMKLKDQLFSEGNTSQIKGVEENIKKAEKKIARYTKSGKMKKVKQYEKVLREFQNELQTLKK